MRARWFAAGFASCLALMYGAVFRWAWRLLTKGVG